MKKIYYLLLILISTSAFSQKFEFDFVTYYDVNFINQSTQRITYSNSNNPNHFMKISEIEHQQIASVYDLENLKEHRFKVTQKQEGENFKNYFEYERSKSFKLNQIHLFEKYVYDFKTIKTDTLNRQKTVLLTIYPNSKKKNAYRTYELIIAEQEANHFPNFRAASIHPMEFYTHFDTNENGLVIESKEITKEGKKHHAKLIHSEAIQFELTVNKSQ